MADDKDTSNINRKVEMEVRVKSHEDYRNRIIRGVGSERWSRLTFTGTDDNLVIRPYTVAMPERLIPITELTICTDSSCGVHFYLDDYRFLPIMENLDDYVPMLARMSAVVTADCSQYVDMPDKVRYERNCLNKRMAAFLQSKGVRIIVNVSWSTPDSFGYAFDGIPAGCPIAVSSIGVRRYRLSTYLWQLGYKNAVERLSPPAILRYGDRMPFEYDNISVYFENERLKRLRNGR